MSKILVNCVDQTLEVKQSPLIASGDVLTDEVDFDFCDEWKLYKKTAIFYRSPDKIYPVDVQVKSDGQNYCVIPYEVLRERGTMYFGVYGTLTIDAGTDDEEQRVRTSEVLSYEIVQGAFAVTNVPDPTPNIYERLFNSIGVIENLKTSNKSSAVAAINELAEKGAVIYTASITNKAVTSCTVNYAEAVEAFNAGRRVYCDISCGASVFRAELDRYVKDGGAVEDKYIYFNAIVHGGADHSDELWRATLSVDIENTATYSEAKYDDGSTAGGGESMLYVNVTQSGSTITGDKTYAEILAAVTAGKCVIAKLADQSFCLDSVSNDKITFQRLDIVEDDGEGRRSIQKTLIYVYNDGVWTADIDFVAVDTAMSDTSAMPVQNKVVKAYVDGIKTEVPTKTSQLTNDSGYLTLATLPKYGGESE